MSYVAPGTAAETGWWGWIVKAAEVTLDIANGGPQKRRRTREANAEAKAAAERAAAVDEEARQLRIQAEDAEIAALRVVQAETAAAAAAVSWWDKDTLGVPNVALVVGGVALVAYGVWPRGER